jgi:hypothetical protein
MKAKELKQKMLDMIYLGHSRQEIYDHFRAQFPNRTKDLADILVNLPTLEQRKKMGVFRIVLLVALVVWIAAKLVYGIVLVPLLGYSALVVASIVTAISIFLVVLIVAWEPRAFKALGGMYSFFLFQISIQAAKTNINLDWVFGTTLALVIVVLSFYIAQQITAKVKVSHKQVRKPDGKIITEMSHTIE